VSRGCRNHPSPRLPFAGLDRPDAVQDTLVNGEVNPFQVHRTEAYLGSGVRFWNKGVVLRVAFQSSVSARQAGRGRPGNLDSRALLASKAIQRREGPRFPLEIAALSLDAHPLCSENAPLNLCQCATPRDANPG
jgi:hypothetical protein